MLMAITKCWPSLGIPYVKLLPLVGLKARNESLWFHSKELLLRARTWSLSLHNHCAKRTPTKGHAPSLETSPETLNVAKNGTWQMTAVRGSFSPKCLDSALQPRDPFILSSCPQPSLHLDLPSTQLRTSMGAMTHLVPGCWFPLYVRTRQCPRGRCAVPCRRLSGRLAHSPRRGIDRRRRS